MVYNASLLCSNALVSPAWQLNYAVMEWWVTSFGKLYAPICHVKLFCIATTRPGRVNLAKESFDFTMQRRTYTWDVIVSSDDMTRKNWKWFFGRDVAYHALSAYQDRYI